MRTAFQSLLERASTAEAAGQTTVQIRLLRLARRRASNAGDSALEGAVLNNVALALMRVGRTQAARTSLLRAVELLQQPGSNAQLITALSNLGYVERELGHVAEAQDALESVLRALGPRSPRSVQARTFIELGLTLKDRGKYSEARGRLERALHVLGNRGPLRLRAHAESGLGLVHELLNELPISELHHRSALKLYRRAGDRENEALTLRNLGELRDKTGAVAEAFELYQQALAIDRAIGAESGVVQGMASAAALYESIGDAQQLEPMQRSVLQQLRAIGDLRGELWAAGALAITLRNSGKLDEAEHVAANALRRSALLADPKEQYELHVLRAEVRQLRERPDQAVRDYQAAIKSAESIRAQLLSEDEALGYFSDDRLLAYERLAALNATVLRRSRAAVAIVERAKSREFLRRLRWTNLSPRSNVPATMVTAERLLVDKLRGVTAELARTNIADRPTLIEAIQAGETALQQLWAEMVEFDPPYVDLRRADPIQYSEIRRLLHQPRRFRGVMYAAPAPTSTLQQP